MNLDKIKTLLLGMASINRMLIQETQGSDYWGAVTDEFSNYLIMAGTELQMSFAAEGDTEEFEPLVVENMTDTREFPAVKFYDAPYNEVEARRQAGTFGG